ncbi:MAG: NAD-dependent ligase LigA [Bacteroidota bacterium]|jgi:DNA ligase (NAD+)
MSLNYVSTAKQLIEAAQNSTLSPLDAEALRATINEADKSYYVNDNPLLADAEYDALFKALKQLEAQYPEIITSTSPTQRVAHGLSASFANVPHMVPMLSLENSYDANDLLDWDRKCRELSNKEQIEYCVEPKYDGASISLIYDNDKLTRAATRGDGVQGDDITVNAKQIKSIPLAANFSEYGFAQVEVRGEILINKKAFDAYNAQQIAKGLAPLANARNATSGSLRLKDPAEVAARGLEGFMYHLSHYTLSGDKQNINTHHEALNMLQQLGIKSSLPQAKLCNTIQEVIEHVQHFEAERDNLPYEIDGMVIKVNSFALQDQIGQTSHHPRWAIAYKFKARQATSKLLGVEFQVGRTGSITPVAKIEPVNIGGVMVSSVSLHNHDMILEKDIRIGDTILAERAGDVIPYIVKSFAELRNGSEQIIQFPTTCPVCNSALIKPEKEAVWRCSNYNCAAQMVERIIHFASKDAMDIRGLGDANIRTFYNEGILRNIADIYKLPYAQLMQRAGLGEKSIVKLQEAIDASKQQNLARVIYGLGIRYVGETTSKTLARHVQHITELYALDKTALLQLEDVGEKVAQSIVDFFADDNNKALISELQDLGLSMANEQNAAVASGGLAGKTFLFTGTLSQFKRAAAEQMVEQQGGNILGSVSAKLNYLVVGEDAGSKLEKAKKLGTITILSEQQFLDLLATQG